MSTHFPVRPGLWQHVEVPSGTYSTRERNAARKVHILNLPAGGEGGGPVDASDVLYAGPEGSEIDNVEQAFAGVFGNLEALVGLIDALTARVDELEQNQSAG